jgi:hypothetical protein
MKILRLFTLTLTLMALICAAVDAFKILADTKPNIQLNTDKAAPREVEDVTQRAVLRDYTSAWQALNTALANNTIAPLNDNFTGFALDKFTQRVNDQKVHGLTTKLVDHGHHVDAIFYSRDGSAIELRDTANIETQVLDGSTVLHSDTSQIHYIAVMTGAADRWQVRVLEESGDRP